MIKYLAEKQLYLSCCCFCCCFGTKALLYGLYHHKLHLEEVIYRRTGRNFLTDLEIILSYLNDPVRNLLYSLPVGISSENMLYTETVKCSGRYEILIDKYIFVTFVIRQSLKFENKRHFFFNFPLYFANLDRDDNTCFGEGKK